MYLFYVDDAFSSGGDPSSWHPDGRPFFLHTAVAISLDHWRPALTQWRELRHTLAADYGLTKATEIHSAEFLSGRKRFGNTPTGGQQARIDRGKAVRRDVFRQLLAAVAELPSIHVLAAESMVHSRQRSYRVLLSWLEEFLSREQTYGMVAVDGTDASYAMLHRELDIATRRIVEDAWMKDSARSQFMQMADLVSHTTFQAIVRRRSREYAWEWHDEYIKPRMIDGGGLCGVRTGP